MYFTYILYSKSLDQFYKGSTKDINDRLHRHNSGFEKYTSVGKPWVLLWKATKETKSEAYKLEFKLKNLNRNRLIKFMLKYKDDIVDQELLTMLSNDL